MSDIVGRRTTEAASSASSGPRIETGEVELGQLRDDRGHGRDLVVEIRARATSADAARRSERGWPRARRLIRSRSSPPTPSRRRRVSASSRGRLPSGMLRKQATHADRPARQRRLASGEDDAGVVPEGRDEGLLQPEIDRPQDLIAIEDEDDAIAEGREPGGGIGRRARSATGRARDRRQEAARRGLDGSGVEEEDDRAARSGLGRERLDEADLPSPPMPWTKTTRGPSSLSTLWRKARSASRPTRPAPCASIRCPTVSVISSPAESAPDVNDDRGTPRAGSSHLPARRALAWFSRRRRPPNRGSSPWSGRRAGR